MQFRSSLLSFSPSSHCKTQLNSRKVFSRTIGKLTLFLLFSPASWLFVSPEGAEQLARDGSPLGTLADSRAGSRAELEPDSVRGPRARLRQRRRRPRAAYAHASCLEDDGPLKLRFLIQGVSNREHFLSREKEHFF